MVNKNTFLSAAISKSFHYIQQCGKATRKTLSRHYRQADHIWLHSFYMFLCLMLPVFKGNASVKNTKRKILKVELSCHLENRNCSILVFYIHGMKILSYKLKTDPIQNSQKQCKILMSYLIIHKLLNLIFIVLLQKFFKESDLTEK